LKNGTPSADALREEQLTDPECIAIKDSMFPYAPELDQVKDLSSEDLQNQRAHHLRYIRNQGLFVVSDDILYKYEWSKDEEGNRSALPSRRTPVLPSTFRQTVLMAFHDRLGHPNRDRVLSILKRAFWWPGMDSDANQYVKRCHECTLAKLMKTNPMAPPTSTPSLGTYPFDVVYCDVLSMAPTIDYDASLGKGYAKLIVFIDSLSRWVEVEKLHSDPSSAQVFDIFYDCVVSRYGWPRRVITDNAGNLAGSLCTYILEHAGTDLRPTRPRRLFLSLATGHFYFREPIKAHQSLRKSY
jgi:hypothetical protein